MPPSLNPLAEGLNRRLEAAAPEVLAMLSAYGRRIYFPKGILSQSAEAKQKAKRFNATIGIATEGDGPMHLASTAKHLGDIEPAEGGSGSRDHFFDARLASHVRGDGLGLVASFADFGDRRLRP